MGAIRSLRALIWWVFGLAFAWVVGPLITTAVYSQQLIHGLSRRGDLFQQALNEVVAPCPQVLGQALLPANRPLLPWVLALVIGIVGLIVGVIRRRSVSAVTNSEPEMIIVPMDASGAWPDALHLVRTCALLFGLGVVMGFSPTTVGIQIDTLRKSAGAPRRVAVIVGAVAVAATLLALLFIVISPNTLHALWTGDVRTVLEQRWFDAAVGAVLIIVGVLRWRRSRRPRRTSSSDRLDRPRVLATVTFVNSMISTTGPATMYLVARTIGTTVPPAWPVEYLIFLAGLAAPYVVLAIVLIRVPGVERRFSDWMADLARRDLRRPIAALIMVVGAALIIWALVAVISR